MKKIFVIALALITLLSFSACSGKSGGKPAENSTKSATGDVITAEIPTGWSLVSGTEMTGIDSSDFICHSEKYALGDAYLQIAKDERDVSAVEETLKSGETFGAYIGASQLGEATWYIAENAAAALIGEKVCLVRGYKCDFKSAEVQGILGGLQWAK